MLTPATTASSTSLPDVIIENAFSMHVIEPAFLNRWPLPEETTTGFTLFFVCIVGACPKAGAAAAAAIPAVLVTTNSRREILSGISGAPTAQVCGRARRL